MQNESSIGVAGSSPEGAVVSSAVGSPSTSQGSSAPSEQSLATTQPLVQGADQSQTSDDPLSGLPTLEELQAQVAQNVPGAKGMAQLRGEYEKLSPQLKELQGKFTPYESHLSRFEQPEQLQSVLDLHDNLIGWERAPSGELVPNTMGGAERLAKEYPLHADYLAADLLNLPSRDPESGQMRPRIDIALAGMAKSPEARANALKILGAVEPSSISPQWQATAEELEVVRPELQDIYKKLPYEERQELKLAAPDFINRTLEREKLTQELQSEREQSQASTQKQIEAREQYINQQANNAGEQYVQSQISEALTTFHNSVVEQCNFISPLDMQNLPQGMTPEQATQMNQQIAESNKSEASQITLAVIGLVNPQTRPFVLPLLQQIGVVDEKLIRELDEASGRFGDNGRNYGHLFYRGKLGSNGNSFQPDASMTSLKNTADNGRKLMVHIANTVKSRLMEKRSQFFSMKAQDHNQTLNNVAGSRQVAQGSAFDPNTATTQRPQGWLSREDIARQYS